MPSRAQVLSVLAAAAVAVKAADGPFFSTGPTSSGTYITSATATLILPDAPSGNEGDLSLWVGMGTSDGDLIQSIADCYVYTTWSVFAYTLKETSPTSQEVIEGETHAAATAQEVTMLYQYDSSTGNYTQTVSLNGAVVSTLSTSDGYAEGWGSAVECAATNCGTVPAHQWINAEIVLSGADPDYIDTLYLGLGATGSMSSSDGGVTWVIGTIDIPEYTF
ncbi:hypothetical protein M406DRAFT_245797 [Cryphonectria parasitica EP155]|uniref:Uncharacterized protein n=1 Tax=Cryphonectria parasitica (strain ATCC 38755 / EP155) TaxID=660469 RepID=A0A9P5CVE6_CRYP1|nr:uncharacterized protein M406DRAFT_245797 [Cryphonectria parasitica EP155]KAF3771302.1 hypothetical protein M406DRAFT_245797 [Cryphonectria parasitica EP155]